MLEKVLNSENYQKDKYAYSLVDLMKTSDSFEYLTDGEKYLVCRSTRNTPVWVWTKDGLSEYELLEVLEKLESLLDKEKCEQVTSKKELFNLLVDKYKNDLVDDYFMEKENYLQMRCYVCLNPVLNKEVVGYKTRPTLEDLDLLAYFYKCDLEDTLKEKYVKEVSRDDLYEAANKRLNNENFYVWKVDDEVVATASYKVEGDCARLSHVFTDRDHRGKGYAQMLVYDLCMDLKNQGKLPLLYADYDYVPSNKAYQKVGFVDVGDLYNVKLFKNKMKKLTR